MKEKTKNPSSIQAQMEQQCTRLEELSKSFVHKLEKLKERQQSFNHYMKNENLFNG